MFTQAACNCLICRPVLLSPSYVFVALLISGKQNTRGLNVGLLDSTLSGLCYL